MNNAINLEKNFAGSYVGIQNERKIRFRKEKGQWIATERVNNKNRSRIGGQNLKETVVKAFEVNCNFWDI